VLLLSTLVRGTLLKKKIGSRTRIRKLPRITAAEKAAAIEVAKDSFSEMAAQILTIDNFFNEKLHSPALRPAARLLLHIVVNRSVSIKQAMLDSPLSYRAFYIMIERLKDEVYLDVQSDSADRRVRRLVLGRQFDRIMRELPAYSKENAVKNHPVP
jgi:hypothetical protein